jgi:hypothetical protein
MQSFDSSLLRHVALEHSSGELSGGGQVPFHMIQEIWRNHTTPNAVGPAGSAPMMPGRALQGHPGSSTY